MSSTIWNEIAEQPAVVAAAAAEQAGRLEQLPGLERAALEVAVDRRVGVVALPALERLAAGERERRLGEDRDGVDVAAGRELGEGAREDVVARGPGRVGTVGRPGGRLAAPHAGAVDQVVVHERRHVDELDRRAGRDRGPRAGGRGEEGEHRPQALAAGGQRLGADLGDEARMAGHRPVEQLLDLAQVLGEARSGPDDVERGAHRAVAVCSATMEPPKSRNCVPSNPLSSISAARSSAPGNRRTLAGR